MILWWTYLLFFLERFGKVLIHIFFSLREKSKSNLSTQLKDLTAELALLGVPKVNGGTPNKLSKIQQETPLDDSFGSFEHISSQSTPQERRERRPWTPSDDVLLISSWLNTNKDPVVGNEQKGGAFWKRIAAYYAASPKAASRDHREASQCKQMWHKINDLVCKFCGAYEAATREKASGQNENDVLKLAHQIFFNDHKKKFTLEHAWKELKNDQKWCELSQTKTDASSKRRRSEEGSEPPGLRTEEMKSGEDDISSNRPPGVKSAKARGKREKAEDNTLSKFQSMWEIKEKDLAMKERLSKMGLLDSLIAKKEPLSDIEEALKKKLITDMLAN